MLVVPASLMGLLAGWLDFSLAAVGFLASWVPSLAGWLGLLFGCAGRLTQLAAWMDLLAAWANCLFSGFRAVFLACWLLGFLAGWACWLVA
jgi:hypothetical protein